MAGRGRGRGRGGMSFDYTQLGVLPGDQMSAPVFQPPPAYPPMEHRPAPLKIIPESEYMVALKRDFVEFLQHSLSYIENNESLRVVKRFSDKYNTVNKTNDWQNKFNWDRFPAELRPKTIVKNTKKRKAELENSSGSIKKAHVDITKKLDELAKQENTLDETEIKQEEEEEEDKDEEKEETEEVEEDLDEEMDDGTDYVNNYFDNGEGFEDEDDLDDGPVY